MEEKLFITFKLNCSTVQRLVSSALFLLGGELCPLSSFSPWTLLTKLGYRGKTCMHHKLAGGSGIRCTLYGDTIRRTPNKFSSKWWRLWCICRQEMISREFLGVCSYSIFSQFTRLFTCLFFYWRKEISVCINYEKKEKHIQHMGTIIQLCSWRVYMLYLAQKLSPTRQSCPFKSNNFSI